MCLVGSSPGVGYIFVLLHQGYIYIIVCKFVPADRDTTSRSVSLDWMPHYRITKGLGLSHVLQNKVLFACKFWLMVSSCIRRVAEWMASMWQSRTSTQTLRVSLMLVSRFFNICIVSCFNHVGNSRIFHEPIYFDAFDFNSLQALCRSASQKQRYWNAFGGFADI